MGGNVIYIDAAQADPLPRVARMAVSVETGLLYSDEVVDWRLFTFEWSSEAEDLLVRRSPDGSFTYKGWLGDIGFFDNVIKGNSKNNIIIKKSWELNLLEFISLRRGSYENRAGRVFYDADGFGLRSSGLLKIAFILNPQLESNSVLSFLGKHVDVQYNTGKFNASPGHPLYGTKFKGVRVSFF